MLLIRVVSQGGVHQSPELRNDWTFEVEVYGVVAAITVDACRPVSFFQGF